MLTERGTPGADKERVDTVKKNECVTLFKLQIYM